MTATITVQNTGASDLTLPCGTRIPARQSVRVPAQALADHRGNPVVQAWFGDGHTGILRTEGPLPGDGQSGTACDCAGLQARLTEWVETARRHAAERDAAADVVEAARGELASAKAEIDRLSAEAEQLRTDLAAAAALKAATPPATPPAAPAAMSEASSEMAPAASAEKPAGRAQKAR